MEFFGQLFSLPWTYRGWFYIFFEATRYERHREWHRRGLLYAVFDIAMTIVTIVLELIVVFGMTVVLFRQS